MGADLYMVKIFSENHDKYTGAFDRAVEDRKTARTDEERTNAQERVSSAYDRMFSVCYFRDSYNSSSLFWKLGLSWWEDLPRFTEKSEESLPLLTPQGAKALQKVIRSKKDVLHTNLSSESKDIMEYFLHKYNEFDEFLTKAIKENVDIECCT